MKNIALAGSIRVSMYLKDRIPREEFDKYKTLLNFDADKKDLKKAEDLKQYKPKANANDYCTLTILKRLSGNVIALTALEVGIFRYMDSKAGDILRLIDRNLDEGINLELAFKLSGLSGTIYDHMELLTGAFDLVAILMNAKFDSTDLIRMTISADYRLASHLNGIPLFDADFIDNAMILTDDMTRPLYGCKKEIDGFTNKARCLFETMMEPLRNSPDEIPDIFTPTTLAIIGEKGSGRTTTVTELCKTMEMPIFAVDFKLFLNHKNPRDLLYKAIRECLLYESALCIRNIEPGPNTEELLERIRQRAYSLGFMPLILTMSPDVKVAHFIEGQLMEFRLPRPSGDMSYELWNGFLSEADISLDFDVRSLASKIKLLPGQIEKIVSALVVKKATGSRILEKDVYAACYNVLDDGRYENIKRVKTNISLSQVRTNDRNAMLLQAIIDQVNYRDRVYTDWKMQEKYSYGRCVSVILAGPPGTGKTMAVHALATELGLELYKVDLSQLVDKYIGETEKRLEEVFTKAEKSNMILFFDEADAIMGKRSETKDSHDKYANTEIAYILQRIEEYDGIVILATNYLQNIDAAFMRRIKYVVNFDLPDRDTRLEIWKGAFAENVPLSEDIDFDFLAETFELSGGNIKNIVLNASFIAAADASPVSMEHIMIAISRENTKDKRISFAADYGKYGYMVY